MKAGFIAGFLLGCVPAFGAPADDACDRLTALKLNAATVDSAAPVAAGALGMPRISEGLPAFCRVALTLKPSSDSDIKVEVWLPESSAWNGKFEGVGNPGWAGAVNYADLAQGLRRG